MASWYHSPQGNHTHSQAVDGTMLYLLGQETEQESFSGVCGSPMAIGLPYIYPSCVTVEGACPFRAESRYNSEVGQGP